MTAIAPATTLDYHCLAIDPPAIVTKDIPGGSSTAEEPPSQRRHVPRRVTVDINRTSPPDWREGFARLENQSSSLRWGEAFARLANKLVEIQKGRPRAVDRLILQRCFLSDALPHRLVETVEGGISFCYFDGDRYADLERLKSGEILAATSNRRDRPVVWEVGRSVFEIDRAVAKIKVFIGESA